MGVTINNESTTIERAAAKATGGLKLLYWYQIFALSLVKIQPVVKEMSFQAVVPTHEHPLITKADIEPLAAKVS